MNDLIPMSLLAAGQSAAIGQLLGPPEQIHRLEEHGLRVGAQIEMIRAGASCIIRLAGHKLCFRGDELLRVLVRPGAVA